MKIFNRLSKDDAAHMTRRQKIEYFWDYNKIQTIALIVLVILAVYFIRLAFRRNVPTWLNVAMINEYEDVSENSSLYKGFVQYLDEVSGEKPDLANEKITFDDRYFFDLSDSADFTNSYYQRLVALIENSETDVVIGSYDNIMGIAQGGRVMDLSDKRVRALYNKYSDRIVTYKTEEGKEIPVAIRLSGSGIIDEDTDYHSSDVYLALSSTIKHIRPAELFADYLLQKAG